MTKHPSFVWRQLGERHHAYPLDGMQVSLCGLQRAYGVQVSLGTHCKRCEASLRRLMRDWPVA